MTTRVDENYTYLMCLNILNNFNVTPYTFLCCDGN